MSSMGDLLCYERVFPKRDPRTDPKPGDTLRGKRNGEMIERTITRVGHDTLGVSLPNGRTSCWWMRTYRKWAADAEVIARAD